MKRLFFFCCFVFPMASLAQKKSFRHTPVYQKGLYFSFNPHAVFEPNQAAIGLGLGYRFNKHIEATTEFSYLFSSFLYGITRFKNLSGFRSTTGLRYFYSLKHGFFVGAEFRIKQYTFDDTKSFYNEALNDTLNSFGYRAKHTLIGGAVYWGKRFKITANGKFELEGNIGIGAKQRRIERLNVPEGYKRVRFYDRGFGLVPEYDIEDAYPYFPATFRLIYHL